jgi:SSS family solute:Na+ symporter
MITGASIWLFYTVFVHTAEAKVLGISQLLTGSVTILGAPWTVIDPLIIALPISAIVMIIFQLSNRVAGVRCQG